MPTLTPERPVIILGHGVRLAGAADRVPTLLDLCIPTLTSWPASDLVDSNHPSYFGRPGVYGQRCANKVFARADMIIAIGCRLSIWTVGYSFPLPGQRVVMVDVDEAEVRKIPSAEWINNDVNVFLAEISGDAHGSWPDWVKECEAYRAAYPWLESPTHDDANGFLNPHRFMARLQAHLRPDEVIVADCATGSLAAHQILRLKPPQRLMTSGGLGEMGCGLPGAIGASFARGKGEVICLTADGSMQMNVQELQTIYHHQLPIKTIVFSNDGYNMIKNTQLTLGMKRVGVDKESGLSVPNFVKVAQAYEIAARHVWGPAEIEDCLKWLLAAKGPALLEVHIDPDLVWGPKLSPGKNADGSIRHAKFDEMSP
jgi:acetolactate synthase-1/2/3 large subunit